MAHVINYIEYPVNYIIQVCRMSERSHDEAKVKFNEWSISALFQLMRNSKGAGRTLEVSNTLSDTAPVVIYTGLRRFPISLREDAQ